MPKYLRAHSGRKLSAPQQHSTEGEVGYKIYVPKLQNTVVGVNCLFNEVILPTYAKEYFHELNKMQFYVVKTPSAVEDSDVALDLDANLIVHSDVTLIIRSKVIELSIFRRP